jgi:hypothetical protein
MCSTLVDDIPKPICSTHKPTCVIAITRNARRGFRQIAFFPFFLEDEPQLIDEQAA